MQKPLYYGFGFALFLLSFGVFVSTFAQIDTTAPQNTLPWGGYSNWVQESLEQSPDTRKTPLGEGNTVKKANSLATPEGKNVLFITDKTYTELGKVGIGIQTPQEILDIRGKNASLKILSSSPFAKLLLSQGGVQVKNTGEVEIFLGENILSLWSGYINSSKNITLRDVNVVLSDQKCPQGEKIKGTDADGNIICGNAEIETVLPDCNLNDIVLSAPLAPLNYCVLGEGEGTPPNNSSSCNTDDGDTLLDESCILQE